VDGAAVDARVADAGDAFGRGTGRVLGREVRLFVSDFRLAVVHLDDAHRDGSRAAVEVDGLVGTRLEILKFDVDRPLDAEARRDADDGAALELRVVLLEADERGGGVGEGRVFHVTPSRFLRLLEARLDRGGEVDAQRR